MNSSPDKSKKAEPLGLSKGENISINTLMASVGTISTLVLAVSLTGNFSKASDPVNDAILKDMRTVEYELIDGKPKDAYAYRQACKNIFLEVADVIKNSKKFVLPMPGDMTHALTVCIDNIQYAKELRDYEIDLDVFNSAMSRYQTVVKKVEQDLLDGKKPQPNDFCGLRSLDCLPVPVEPVKPEKPPLDFDKDKLSFMRR